jgi:hypothetical protein
LGLWLYLLFLFLLFFLLVFLSLQDVGRYELDELVVENI